MSMPKTNTALFIILIIIAVVVVVFIDKLGLRHRTIDPRIWFGVETVELTSDIKNQYDIQSPNGLLVSRIFMGSPAQESGIKQGDVLRQWNGISIISQKQLQYLIQTSLVNERIKIAVDRKNDPALVYSYVGIRPGGV